MGLRLDQIDDFVTLTLNRFRRNQWTDISSEYQHYVSSRFFDPKAVQERGGAMIEFKVKTKNAPTARVTGLFAPDKTMIEDVMISAQVPWSMLTTNFSYSIYEDLFQSDRETIIREMQIREHQALTAMAELKEECLWSAPADPSDIRPMGLPFWLQKNPTANVNGGFHGANPAGFPGGCANVNSDKYTRWRNWTFGYATVNRDDLVVKLKRAIAFTEFTPPVPHPEVGFGKSNYEIFTTYAVTEPLERLAEDRNENLGMDVARYRNQVTVAGVPMRWVPYLDATDSTEPLYGVNWAKFRPFVKTGVNMRRNPPKQSPRQHDTREVHIDHCENYIATDRRCHFVGSLIP
jgi:hypothetical protein